MGSLKKYEKSLPSMGLTFVFKTMSNLLARPTILSTLRAYARWVLTGSRERPYREIPRIEYYSDRIMELLDSKGLAPRSICIDGLPGSGKSSLGRSLAEKTGLEWQTLYWKELREPYPFEKGKIYENIRLIRTQRIEHFDMVVYVDCPIATATERVMERDRDGILVDAFDFPKLKAIGDLAFEMAAGEEIRIEQSPIRIKLRPKGGYRDVENLKDKLKADGMSVTGLSKEEMLFLYCYGRPQEGILPYVKLGAYNDDILSALSAALKRGLAARRLS
jgi:hypothetical protein